MSNGATIDYDALAAQNGGTVAPATVDYDALAAQHGGIPDDGHADVMHGEIKAAPGGLSGWLNSLENDIKNGTGTTLPGRILAGLGAKGIDRGTSEQTANTIAGPLIGPVHAAEGAVQNATGKTGAEQLGGAGKMISGALETASPLLAFQAPEAGEAAAELPGAAKGAYVNFVHKVLPSAMKEDAKTLFASVAGDANKVPVSLDQSQDAILRLMDWQKKTQLGPTLNKFLNRVTSPKYGPMTYEEARDFQQLISKLSADEASKLTGPVKFQVQRLAGGLKQDIAGAADTVGRGADYLKAMGDYANAAKWSERYDFIKKKLIQGALAAAGGGLAGTAGKLGYDYLNQK